MTNRQFKNRFLQSKVNECLTNARLCLVSRVPRENFYSDAMADHAKAQLGVALAYARQLPDSPKYRLIRAHIVAAREAING